MNIQQPDTLFCTTQPLDWRGAPHHAFSILLGIDMHTGHVMAADTALAAAMQALPPGCRLDIGVPKQEAEWLLAGVISPRTKEGAVAEIRVGQSRRRFLILPSPDGTPVPLNWENTAFDAEGNPQGSRTPLVSDPALRHGVPACPLPLGAWPCRMKNMGTYDARWLKTRWPGLPDDADWRFFNEAQPQQRLPGGLRGDEEICLSGFRSDGREWCFRLPGARLTLEILRQQEQEWKAHAVHADTLWLFPGQAAALLYWHALVPCADEAASDIAAARLHLSPEQLESVPPPAPPEAAGTAAASADTPPRGEAVSSGMAAAAVTAAGMAAGAAAMTATTAASGSARTTQTNDSSAAEQTAQPMPPGGASSPVADTAAQPRSAAEIAAVMQAELTKGLPEINAALTEAGLPPLSPEQIEETRRHIETMSDLIAKVEAAPPPPPLEEQLRQAGIPDDRIAAINAALKLEVPDPAKYPDSASWQAASNAFLDEFSALLQPDEALRNSMSQMLHIMGPDGQTALRALAKNPPETTQGLLEQAGMRPDNAARLLDMLEDAPTEPEELVAYARTLEAAAGFPPGSVSERLQDYYTKIRELAAETGMEKPASVAASPVQQEQTARTETTSPAAETAPESAPEATSSANTAPADAEKAQASTPPPDTSGDAAAAPASRAAVLALLASGASLAGVCLAGLDLSGLRFDGQNLAGTDFSDASLRGASFVDADLSGAHLARADASDAVFLRTRLEGAQLQQLRAVDADFTDARLAGADAREADLSRCLFQGSQAADLHATQATFTQARLRDADFSGADMSGARLCAADLHGLKLDGARLVNADLSGAALNNGTQAPGADFSRASLTGSVWTGVTAPQAVFLQAAADNGSFTDCDLTGTRWDAVCARHADFSRSNLRGAQLQRANFFEASLRETRLHAADIRHASLYGADLYRLGLDDTTRLDGTDIGRTILAAVKKA